MHFFRNIATLLILSTSLATAKALPLVVIQNTSKEIDLVILTANKAKGIAATPIINDATFLRRSYLNIIGRIPTYQESKSFLDSKEKNKRSALIDSLVYSPGFNSRLFNFYANLLRVRSEDRQFGLGWNLWLKQSIKENKPYDQLVREMLSASGHCSTNPEVGYYLRDRGMLLDNISNTSKVFLGTQIGCAQCHDHPFEDWTQKQYYELAAYGAKIEYRSQEAREKVKEVVAFKKSQSKEKQRKGRGQIRKEARDLRSIFRFFNDNSIAHNSGKLLKLPNDYKYNDAKAGSTVTPSLLFGDLPKSIKSDASPHEKLATWVTSGTNPMFSKVIVNRLWKHALGYGLVEPTDNWTDRSDISHPEVLDILVQILHATEFDTRETLRLIYHTKLFQREACATEIAAGRAHDFRGPLLRRMSAEEIRDSLLTLEEGNIDARENVKQAKLWKDFQDNIRQLLDAPASEIIKLDDMIDSVEDATRKHRTEARKLRTEKAKHIADGDSRKAQRVQKKLSEVQSKIREVRQDKSKQENKKFRIALRNNLRVNSKIPLRSSEMPSPLKPGSFARDFGASDRRTTNAQHTHASIPQALNMLNGKQINQITRQKGTLAKRLKGLHKPEERLNVLFLNIYNAYPTDQEVHQFSRIARSKQDILILAKSMLNSKRFLFVQ